MNLKYAYFVLILTIVSWCCTWGIVDREKKYAKITLPKRIRTILFPFHRNGFTLHNIIYLSIVYIIDILYIISIFFGLNQEATYALYMLIILPLCFLNIFIFLFLDFKYWLKNRNKQPEYEPVIHPPKIIFAASKSLGLQKGQSMNKEIKINSAEKKIMKELFLSLLYYIENEEFHINSKGKGVKIIQCFLGIKHTGKFTSETRDAIIELQEKLSITPDGIFNHKIIDVINEYVDNI